ncbi:MAG: alkylhydroperoxidase-related (seleno)protein [Actinomycetota bacterium]
MTAPYSDAVVPVRADLRDAHLTAARTWAEPGGFWTGYERLAIVNEVRRARRAEPLPPWVAPTTVDGLIEPGHVLPAPAVDAVWRLANHPGTTTQDWYQQLLDRGLDAHQYVELVSLVATATCIDVFASTVDAEPVPLPAPAEGQPDGATAPGVSVSTHWVPTADVRGPNVGKALSAHPRAMELWLGLSDAQYVPMRAVSGDLSWDRGTIDRSQIELLAARTSLLNECFY